jgi:hypothetical protein
VDKHRLWAVPGLVVVIITAAIATPNLQEIYNAQTDFVVGSLLSLAGFCFGKATNRTAREMLDRLHSRGTFEQLAKLERNVEATVDRLAEYYDSQARSLDFYRNAPLLRVAVDDLDKAAANLVQLRTSLGEADRPRWQLPPSSRLALICIRRDLREAMIRRDQTYERLALQLGDPAGQEAWDVFAVVTGDLLKAAWNLEALLGQHIAFPPDESIHKVIEYLAAARNRGTQFIEAVRKCELVPPKVFEIMISDIENALQALRTVRAGEQSADQPKPPVIVGELAGRPESR